MLRRAATTPSTCTAYLDAQDPVMFAPDVAAVPKAKLAFSEVLARDQRRGKAESGAAG